MKNIAAFNYKDHLKLYLGLKEWRTILKLKNEIRKFILFQVKDEKIIFYSMTNSILLVIYDPTSSYESMMDLVLWSKNWVWKLARFENLVTI